MTIYSVTIWGEVRYVRATEEDDGRFTTEDVRHGVAGTVDRYVYTYAGSLEELVAKGARTYPTPFAAGATEYRVTSPGPVTAGLDRDAAVEMAQDRLGGRPPAGWPADQGRLAEQFWPAPKPGRTATIERRRDGGDWVAWRRYVVRHDGGIARADR
jgi:hypothetical protein